MSVLVRVVESGDSFEKKCLVWRKRDARMATNEGAFLFSIPFDDNGINIMPCEVRGMSAAYQRRTLSVLVNQWETVRDLKDYINILFHDYPNKRTSDDYNFVEELDDDVISLCLVDHRGFRGPVISPFYKDLL